MSCIACGLSAQNLLVQLVDEEGVEEVAFGEPSQFAHFHIPLLKHKQQPASRLCGISQHHIRASAVGIALKSAAAVPDAMYRGHLSDCLSAGPR